MKVKWYSISQQREIVANVKEERKYTYVLELDRGLFIVKKKHQVSLVVTKEGALVVEESVNG